MKNKCFLLVWGLLGCITKKGDNALDVVKNGVKSVVPSY